MGTNYYRIPTQKEVEERRSKLISDITKMDISPSSIERKFSEQLYIDSFDRYSPWDIFTQNITIHLGKRSFGWKFCWNFHNGKWYTNKEELLEFIREGRVVNEYGEEQDVEEFIKMALEWGQPDGLVVDGEYEESQRSKGRMAWGPKHWDKIVDGLRVCSSIEFS
jgi:hypothetical protein